MRVTTSGETHKKEVLLGNQQVELFLEKQKSDFLSLCSKKNVIYNKNTVISDISLNYLNIKPDSSVEECLKNILLKEYYDCEKIYPYLGDYMLHSIFNKRSIKHSSNFIFSKKNQFKFVDSLRIKTTRLIADWVFENTNLNRSVNVEKYNGKELSVEKLEEFTFNIQYDFSFYNNLKAIGIKNYRFVIINGIVESVGEIHHLLYSANKKREPYVIFCFGMSEEVKQTIVRNNAEGRFRVFPVCFDVNNENSLNILNDIAAIHDSSVITSDLGQTISQEVRKELPIGEKISFLDGNIIINPVADRLKIESHRKFLRSRIEEAETKPDVRTDVLKNRLKMFTGKRINFYIPKHLLKNKTQSRELDYFFRFVGNLKMQMKIVSLAGEKFYIPEDYINIVETKKKSLLKKFSEINALIV